MALAFIVEGQMEQRAIARICPGAKVVRIGTGGKNVTMQKMSEFIASTYRIFSNRYYPVVILFDREDRTQSAADLQAELGQHLANAGVAQNQLIICVTDRDIERWLQAHVDQQGIFQVGGTGSGALDGQSGQGFIENALRNQGVIYHKTTIGVQLLASIIPSVVAGRSVSFDQFRNQIVRYCTWAQR